MGETRQLSYNELIKQPKSCKCGSLQETDQNKENIDAHIQDTSVHFQEGEKEQLNNLLLNAASFITQDILDSYYTKEEIENKKYLQEIPDYYITESELRLILETGEFEIGGSFDYYNKEEINNLISNIYTKEEVDTRYNYLLSIARGYVTLDYFNEELSKLTNKPSIQNIKYVNSVTNTNKKTYKLGTLVVDDSEYDITAYTSWYDPSEDVEGGGNTDDDNKYPWEVSKYVLTVYLLVPNSVKTVGKPEGGGYNFVTNKIIYPVGGWESLEEVLDKKQKNNLDDYTIWWSSNIFFSDGTNSGWTNPLTFVVNDDILHGLTKYSTYNVSVYCVYNGSGEVQSPTGGSFDVGSKKLAQVPMGFSDKKERITWHMSPIQEDGTMFDGTIWVSYNDYTVVHNDGVSTLNNPDGSGWTHPIKYRNVSAELDKVITAAEDFYHDQLTSADSELQQQLNKGKGYLNDAEQKLREAEALYKEIEKGEIDGLSLSLKISQLQALISIYGWALCESIVPTSINLESLPLPQLTDKFGSEIVTNKVYKADNPANDAGFYVKLVKESEDKPESHPYSFIECSEYGIVPDNAKPLCWYNTNEREGYFALQGQYNTTESNIIRFDGTVVGQQINYSNMFWSVVDGRITNTLSQAGITTGRWKESIIEQAYNRVLIDVSDTDTTNGTIRDAMQQITADAIHSEVSRIEQLEADVKSISSSNMEMTPEHLVLSVLQGESVSGIKIVPTNITLNGTTSIKTDTFEQIFGRSEFVKDYVYKFTNIEYNFYYKIVDMGSGFYVLVECDIDGTTTSSSKNVALYEIDSDYDLEDKDKYSVCLQGDHNTTINDTILIYGKEQSVDIVNKDTIQSSMIQMVKDRITLSVVNSENGDGVQISLDGSSASITLDAPTVEIPGDLVASQIYTNGLEVHGKKDGKETGNIVAWIKGTTDSNGTVSDELVGQAMFGNHSAIFNPDGSGKLAGGLINWSAMNSEDGDPKDFELNIQGVINATGGKVGGWSIDKNTLYSINEDNGVVLSPSALYAGNVSRLDLDSEVGNYINKLGWMLNSDGSGFVANGFITWDAKGNMGGVAQLPTINARRSCYITPQNYKTYLLRIPRDKIADFRFWNGDNPHDYIIRSLDDTVLKESTHVYMLDLSACEESIIIDDQVLYEITETNRKTGEFPSNHQNTVIYIPTFDTNYTYRYWKEDSSSWTQFPNGTWRRYEVGAYPYLSSGKPMSFSEYMNCVNKTYTIMIENDTDTSDRKPVNNLFLAAFSNISTYNKAILSSHYVGSNDYFKHVQWIENGWDRMVDSQIGILPPVYNNPVTGKTESGCISKEMADSIRLSADTISQSPFLFRYHNNENDILKESKIQLDSPYSEKAGEEGGGEYEISFSIKSYQVIETVWDHDGNTGGMVPNTTVLLPGSSSDEKVEQETYNETATYCINNKLLFEFIKSGYGLTGHWFLNGTTIEVNPYNQG